MIIYMCMRVCVCVCVCVLFKKIYIYTYIYFFPDVNCFIITRVFYQENFSLRNLHYKYMSPQVEYSPQSSMTSTKIEKSFCHRDV